jgi:ER membrane protein complex subunit 3
MMQRGVETTDMDVRWVSSLSWYFLNLFGLTSVYTLILGDASGADGLQDMQQMQMMGQPQPLQQPAEVLKVCAADLDIQERGGVYAVGRL